MDPTHSTLPGTLTSAQLYRVLRNASAEEIEAQQILLTTETLDELVQFSIQWLLYAELHGYLEKHGLLVRLSLPVRKRLEVMTAVAQVREQTMLLQIADVHRLFVDNAIPYTLMKGCALIAGGYYPRAGGRYVSDIDLLVAPPHLDLALHALESSGYACTYRIERPVADYWASKHLPPLLKQGEPYPIELHQRPLDSTWLNPAVVSSEAMLRDRRVATTANGPVYIPSDAHLLLHCVYHTQIYDANELAGRQIYRTMEDTARLLIAQPDIAGFLAEHIDRELRHNRTSHSFYQFLTMTSECIDHRLAIGNDTIARSWLFRVKIWLVNRYPGLGRSLASVLLHARALTDTLIGKGRRQREVLRRCNPEEWKFRPVWHQLLYPAHVRYRLRYFLKMLRRGG